MNDNVTKAVMRLQARLDRTSNPWRAEQAEEALNILLSQPDRDGDPQHLMRNALADASKKLKRRTKILAEYTNMVQVLSDQASDGFGILLVEVTDLVNRGLSAADQALLGLFLDGAEANEIANDLQLPVARVRERLSRTRARARAAWGAA